jgi:hypothetical protein
LFSPTTSFDEPSAFRFASGILTVQYRNHCEIARGVFQRIGFEVNSIDGRLVAMRLI